MLEDIFVDYIRWKKNNPDKDKKLYTIPYDLYVVN